MKTGNEKCYKKMSPQLRKLFAKVSAGELSEDTKIDFFIKAKDGFDPNDEIVRSRIGDIMTANASLKKIKEIAKDRDVYYLESSRPMSIENKPDIDIPEEDLKGREDWFQKRHGNPGPGN